MTDIFHSEFTGEIESTLDEYGNEIPGSEVFKYSDPERYQITISAPSGETEAMTFGGISEYDAVMITTDMSCPINETSKLWVENTDITKPNDYVVTRRSKSLNSISFAIRRVDISGKTENIN